MVDNDKRQQRANYDAALIESVINADGKVLSAWNAFSRELKVPHEFMPAIMSGRAELVSLVQPRAMDEKEVAVLLNMIGVLFETNEALRAHAQRVAQTVEIWAASFKQLDTVGRRIEDFANFRDPRPDED